MAMELERQYYYLAEQLFNINAIKFGEFLTKSGIKTPVYFDLRVIVSYPEVMNSISSLLIEVIRKKNYDHLCGVPYTALPIATLISVKAKKSMLMRRKEAKSYGTKKMIEGHYTAGQKCLIIEDVITSGSSVLETVKDLRKEGLVAEDAIVVLDREQGAIDNLKLNNVSVKSLFTLTRLVEILYKRGKISQEIVLTIKKYLQDVKAPVAEIQIRRTIISYEKRSTLAKNTVTESLFNIMAKKQTNLCISVDLTDTKSILDLVDKVGKHACLIKTHADIIEDFNSEFVKQLKELSRKYNFLIMEDRKFADIGNTALLQYCKGVHKISEWADLVTVHSLPGEGVLKALKSSGTECKVFLLAELSCEGNLITPDYTQRTVKMAEQYPELITGFVCQNKNTFDNPALIQLTPGVQINQSGDELGQVYYSPETVIMAKGADIAVVGRGIVKAKNPEVEAVIYKEELWKYYLQRISQ